MGTAIFDTPLLKVKSLESKFDTNFFSNSMVALLGDFLEARIVQQLHYWCYSQYGVIIDGVRWIYKPIREWLSEVFTGFTEWQLRGAISSLLEKGLIEREKLFVKHHQQEHNSPWWNPKNQTYYYSLNYDKLQELIEQHENAETLENIRFVTDTKLSVEDFSDTKSRELSQNNTDLTSIENITNKSHPIHPQAGGKNSKKQNQENSQAKIQDSTLELEKILERETNLSQQNLKEDQIFRDVDEKINVENKNTNYDDESTTEQDTNTSEQNIDPIQQDISTTKTKPRKTPRGTKSKRKEAFALWDSPEQRESFRRDLNAAIASGVGRARNITALVAHVMNEVRQGHSHTYWEEWISGQPIGSSEKQEWEAHPGKPFPKFVEYLLEKLIYPNESRQQALFRVGKILTDREQAELYWRDFKRNIEALRQQSEQMQREGKTPTVPTWFVDRVDVSLSRASESAQKVAQLTPNQRDWLEEKLPESEKLIPGVNCPPLLPAEEVTVEDTAEDEDLEFCFDGFITLDYLEHQARKIAANSGLVGILLPDFRAAFSQANSAQRERIRSVISSIYPDLLNLI